MSNDRAYIHEFIDIRGAHRANYMHHMAANWSPMAQEDRGQSCFGIWAVVGTTGPWPQVCNIWEEPGLDGLARSLTGENVGQGLQDPKLERWWKEAAEFRRGGFDRVLLPAPWSPTLEDSLRSSRSPRALQARRWSWCDHMPSRPTSRTAGRSPALGGPRCATRMKSSCCGLFPRATPLGPPANTHRSRILRC